MCALWACMLHNCQPRVVAWHVCATSSSLHRCAACSGPGSGMATPAFPGAYMRGGSRRVALFGLQGIRFRGSGGVLCVEASRGSAALSQLVLGLLRRSASAGTHGSLQGLALPAPAGFLGCRWLADAWIGCVTWMHYKGARDALWKCKQRTHLLEYVKSFVSTATVDTRAGGCWRCGSDRSWGLPSLCLAAACAMTMIAQGILVDITYCVEQLGWVCLCVVDATGR